MDFAGCKVRPCNALRNAQDGSQRVVPESTQFRFYRDHIVIENFMGKGLPSQALWNLGVPDGI